MARHVWLSQGDNKEFMTEAECRNHEVKRNITNNIMTTICRETNLGSELWKTLYDNVYSNLGLIDLKLKDLNKLVRED